MKLYSFLFCFILMGTSAAQAEVINRRNQCDRWEYIPASEQLGNPATALLFCSEEERVWLSLRIECRVDEKRMAVTYHPGFNYSLSTIAPEEPTEEFVVGEAQLAEDLFAQIPLENAVETTIPDVVQTTREMVFLDFRSFGYTSVAFQGDSADWQFFEPEPLSPIFSRLITGSYADISLLATGQTERLPLRGSGKALRPIVETCRLAKKKS